MKEKKIRIGVDVGGTNTDICAIDEETGELLVYKLPSSLYDQSDAVVKGVKILADENGFEGQDDHHGEGRGGADHAAGLAQDRRKGHDAEGQSHRACNTGRNAETGF